MTYDLFWNDDCELVKAYREAFRLKNERELEEQNFNAWLHGVYTYDALCAVSPVLHAFTKSGTEPIPYHKKPLKLKSEKTKTIPDKEQKMREMMSVMSKWAENINTKKTKEGANNG